MTGGYTVKRTVFRLRFEDPSLEGCQVRVRAMSVQDLIDISAEIPDLRLDGSWSSGMSINVELLMEKFAGFLDEWNLEEEDGAPVPPTVAGLKSLELKLVVSVLAAWLANSAGVMPDLSEGSNSGEPSQEESSLPMEPVSDDPPS